MKKWNTTAKIKTAILVIAGLVNLISPFKPFQELDILSLLSSLLFPLIFLPLIRMINIGGGKKVISKPRWNDNPFVNSMASAEFFAYLFIVVGTCMIISTGIRFTAFNNMGMTAVLFGLGILGGNYLTLLLKKNKNQ